MEEIVKSIAREYVRKHGKMVNYGSGHVVKEIVFEGNLIEISIGSYYETMWINKVPIR